MPAVHCVLPEPLSSAVADVARTAGIALVRHGASPIEAAEAAAADRDAVALIGPFRSEDVAHAVEATAPAGLPLLAPAATWAGVTRADEPGCDDPARHLGTVFRLLARDTEVARRVAAHVQARCQRALVVAGGHDYGRQLDGQLRLAGLPRAGDARDADLVVLCGLSHGAEVGEVRDGPQLPVIAFDGVQGADLGAGRDVRLALPFAPRGDDAPHDWLVHAADRARDGARLVAEAIAGGADDRAEVLEHLRAGGSFDAHGDPVEPPVWLWRAGSAWRLVADEPL